MASIFRKLWDRLTGAPAPPLTRNAPEPPASEPSMAATLDASRTKTGAGGPDAHEASSGSEPRWSESDDTRLETRARALNDSGEVAAAVALLQREGMLLAAHASDGLPCLCRRCLVPEVAQAERGGMTFERDFVVARRRVLFYWAPAELGSDSVKLRYSMRSALRARVHELQLERQRSRPKLNPFTGKLVS